MFNKLKKSPNLDKFQKIATELRIAVIEMLAHAGSGHPASALGLADIFTCLYFGDILKHKPTKAAWPKRDYFLLSNGHSCPILYATLAKAGYFPEKELTTLRQLNSRLQGHPHYGSLPGIENTSGSLGQGLSQAAGLALALKMDQKSNHVYCMLSDAEIEEGQTYEALMFAHKYKLKNLTAIIDRNEIQIEGDTHEISDLEPFRSKIESFAWRVIEANGHDYEEILDAFIEAHAHQDKPAAIIFHTISGKGVDFMEGDHEWHGKIPDKKEAEQAIKQLQQLLKK